MEVATTWDRLRPLYMAVRKSVMSESFVMAHFSHAYREGCSIYFTFAAAAKDDIAAVAKYDRIWEKAQGVVLKEGAVVSHHHGIGLSKRNFLKRQLAGASELSRAVKKAFDPEGILNPEKVSPHR